MEGCGGTACLLTSLLATIISHTVPHQHCYQQKHQHCITIIINVNLVATIIIILMINIVESSLNVKHAPLATLIADITLVDDCSSYFPAGIKAPSRQDDADRHDQVPA